MHTNHYEMTTLSLQHHRNLLTASARHRGVFEERPTGHRQNQGWLNDLIAHLRPVPARPSFATEEPGR